MDDMVRLTRAIRMAFDVGEGRLAVRRGTGHTDLSQIPLTLWITLAGPVDRSTGMLINVSEIDAALQTAVEAMPPTRGDAVNLLRAIKRQCDRKLKVGKLLRLAITLNESLSIAVSEKEWEMIEITMKYELAAAHRLGREEWGERKNAEVFGKCGNPAGHGHNYLVEVTLRGRCDGETGRLIDQGEVDRIVRERVVGRFDHKNLNEDTEEFAELSATMENMAKVFWELLIGQFGEVQLASVAVWETAKTRAAYFGPGAGGLRFGELV